MNNKKITAADLDPEFLVQLINKNGDLSSAEKALANACVGRDEKIGEHQLPDSYTKAVEKKITDLQNKLAKVRLLANKIDRGDLSANIINKLDVMEKQIAALQVRNATIVYQYSADADQNNRSQAVFDNLNKQINALTLKTTQNEKRSMHNESSIEQNAASIQEVLKSHNDLKSSISSTAAQMQAMADKQQIMSTQQDEDTLTLQHHALEMKDLETRVDDTEKSMEALKARFETSSQEALKTRLNEQEQALLNIKTQQNLNTTDLDTAKLDISANKTDIANMQEELGKNEDRFNSAISTIGSLTESTKEAETELRKSIVAVQQNLDGEIEQRSSITGDMTKKLNQAIDEISTNTGQVEVILSEMKTAKDNFDNLKLRYDALEINALSDIATLKKRVDNNAVLYNQLDESVTSHIDSLNNKLDEIHENTSMPQLRSTVINEQYPINKEDLSPALMNDLNALSERISVVGQQVEEAITYPASKAAQSLGVNEYGKVAPKAPMIDCVVCDLEDEAVELKKMKRSPIVCRISKQVLIYDTKKDPTTVEGKANNADEKSDGYEADNEFLKKAENLNVMYHDVDTGAIYFVNSSADFFTVHTGERRYQIGVAPNGTEKVEIHNLNDASNVKLMVEKSFVFEEDGKNNTYTVHEPAKNTEIKIVEGILFIINNSEEAQNYIIIIN